MIFDSENVSVLFQKELPDVMRRGMDEIIQFDKRPEEKRRVYTYENAVKRCWSVEVNIQSERSSKNVLLFIRLLAGNPSISEESVHNILERGLVQVDGGLSGFAPVSYWLWLF